MREIVFSPKSVWMSLRMDFAFRFSISFLLISSANLFISGEISLSIGIFSFGIMIVCPSDIERIERTAIACWFWFIWTEGI